MITRVLAQLGGVGVSALSSIGRAHLLILNMLAGLSDIIRRPRLLIDQLYSVGVLTILIIAVAGLFVGMVLGLQGYYILSRFGGETA